VDQSNFIKGLLGNIVDSKTGDYEGEFGHVFKTYSVRLPNGSVCTGVICNDACRCISKEANQRRIKHMWQVAYNIQRSAYISAQAVSDTAVERIELTNLPAFPP